MKKLFYGACQNMTITCYDEKVLSKYLKDKYEESSSSMEQLNSLYSEENSDETAIPEPLLDFPRILTDDDIRNAKTAYMTRKIEQNT